jgi:hypothetical protein
MTRTGKIVLLTGAAAATGIGYTIWKYDHLKKVDLFPTGVAIHDISLLKAFIRISLELKNYTGFDFNFAYPYMVLHYQGIPVGSSRLKKETITLRNNESVTKDLDIEINMLSVSVAIPNLIGDLRMKRPVVLDAVMHTAVPMFWGLFNKTVERKKTITIKL